MLYEKKINYLDYCVSGEKKRGAGFVKSEVRDGVLRLQININGIYTAKPLDADIILEGGEKESRPARIRLENGAGELRELKLKADKLGGGLTYGELERIRIPLSEKCEIVCFWKREENTKRAAKDKGEDEKQKTMEKPNGGKNEEERKKEEPVRGETEKERKKEEPVRGETEKEKEKEEPVRGGTEKEREKEEPERGETERERKKEPERGETAKEDIKEKEEGKEGSEKKGFEEENGEMKEGQEEEKLHKPREEKHQEETREVKAGWMENNVEEKLEPYPYGENKDPRMDESQACPEKEENQEKPAKHQESTKSSRIDGFNRHEKAPLEDKWRQLAAIYPHMNISGEISDCLTLKPADFVILPQRYYSLVTNSFLLHGYHNYGHLVLARAEKRGEIKYYIGVPGIFFDKERQVALMFGFECFECGKDFAKQGDFGYYLIRVEL